MKLFYHLFSYLLAGMILLIAVDEYISFRSEMKQYEADMIANAIQGGRSISGMIAHTWKESGEEKALQLLQDASESGSIRIHWVWLNDVKEKMKESHEFQKKIIDLENNEIVSFKVRSEDGKHIRKTYVPVDIGDKRKGALELSQTLISFREYSSKMFGRALIVTAMLALICGLILYYFIDRNIGWPLARLMAQADRIEKGDLRTEQSVLGNDELADMARTMNDMCSRLLIAKEKIKFEYDARLKTLEQLRHTERLSSFGLISAGIAHEIGTPLNVVDGRAKMILNEDLSKQEIADCASIIIQQVERMTVIIRQLLDYTRRPRKHISEENIALLIKQVFQLLYPMASKQHVIFSLHREEGTVVTLDVDGSQIQQVLVNLLMNSIQAMPQGGKVDVILSNESISTSRDSEDHQDTYLKVRIEDEGEGICQEDIEDIFTPFFTTKSIGTGTGLGLSIAHGIVDEHNGWIEVEKNVQQGACFTVYLPLGDQNT